MADLFTLNQEPFMSFKFDLQQVVSIATSKEQGVIIGRAEYVAAENSYLMRYAAADGRAAEQWWAESALVA